MRPAAIAFCRIVSFIFLLFLTNSYGVKAQFSVVINEVMINGPGGCDGACVPNTEEWIELHNTACFPVNIGCYRLSDGDFSITIPAGTIIPAQGFYLIGSSNSVIGNASLNLNIGTCASCTSGTPSNIGIFTNGTEQLVLYNSSQFIVDAVIWGGGQALPAAQLAGSSGSCPAVTLTLPLAASPVYENIGLTGGGNGCSLARTFDGNLLWEERCLTGTIQNPSPGATNNPPVTITGNAVVCLGESVTLSAAGGTGIFSWTSSTGLNGSFTQNLVVTPTTTTTYTFTSQSLTGCLTTTSTTVTVTVTPPPTITITSSHPSPVCGSQQVTLTASGASTYSWSTGQTGAVITVTPQTAYTSTYFVTGSNAPGCSDTASISITSIPIIIVTASAASQDICAGESTFLTAAGADSYSWSTGQTGAVIPVSPTSTTTYTVKGSVGSCFNISTVAVNVTPLPAVTTTAALPVVCPGAGGTTLTASGATTYSWTPDPTLNTTTGSVVTANPLVPTTYTVTGTTNGCSNSATILIGTQSSLSVAITAQPGAVCAGQQVSLSATGANSFVWSTGQPGSVISVHPLATTTYSVVGTSGTCTGTNSITITVQPEPVITVIASQQTVCAGEPATLSATGATGYSWSTGQTGTPIQVYPSETTTYSVIGTIGSCSSQPAASTITVTPLPVVAISAPASEICPGDSVMLTANGATSYVWVSDVSLTNISGNTATAAPATTTTFSVTGKTGNCTSLISEFTLNVVAPGVAEAGEEITTNCGQTSVQLMAQTPSQGTGTWTVKSGTGGIIESSSSPATTFSGLAGQTYVLYWAVETICGAGQDSVLVNFSDVPDVWAGSDATILLGESVQLSASGGVSYTWSPATGLSDSGIANPFASPEATTTYTVTATSADGCAASGMVTVAVTYNDLMVPNVFTPNGDGVNDTWAIEGLQVVYPNCEVQVFNRWGVKVFSSKGYTRNWDGGELSTGVYFYHISLGNGEKDVKGHLSIIR